MASTHLLTLSECFPLLGHIHLVELYLLSHCGVYVLQRTESRYPIFALVIIWPGLIHFFLLLFSNLSSQVSLQETGLTGCLGYSVYLGPGTTF